MNIFDSEINLGVYSSADARSMYLNKQTLDALGSFVQQGNQRLTTVNILASKAQLIILDSLCRCPEERNLIKFTNSTRQYAACIRDYVLCLRYVTYAVFTGDDALIFDKDVLKELSGTYIVREIPTQAIIDFIRTIKDVSVSLVDNAENSDFFANVEGNSQLLNAPFETLCSALLESREIYNQALSVSVDNHSEEFSSWEPQNHTEWLCKDPLSKYVLSNGSNESEIIDLAVDFFESLLLLPYSIRKKIFREREVMAALHQRVPDFSKAPGFHSIGVATRSVGGINKVTGIISFVRGTPLDIVSDRANFPLSIRVDSIIPELDEIEKDVPLVLEEAEFPLPYSTQIDSDSLIETQIADIYCLQSGNRISGINSSGTEGGRSTASALVRPEANSRNSLAAEPYLLSVRHGLIGYKEVVSCDSSPHAKIGKVFYEINNSIWQRKSEKLDVSLIELSKESMLELSPYLRWINEPPKKPLPVFSKMPVQMYGGVSGYKTGEIDQALTYSLNSSNSDILVPFFTVDIESVPGDSGALLVTGHGDGIPTYGDSSAYMFEDLDEFANCSQGILKGGVQDINRSSKALFIPMLTILKELKLELCSSNDLESRKSDT